MRTETTVTLLRDTWAVLLECLGSEMQRAADHIASEIGSADWGEAVAVRATTDGWMRVAELIERDKRMKDVAWMLRRQCEAATAASKAELRGL